MTGAFIAVGTLVLVAFIMWLFFGFYLGRAPLVPRAEDESVL